jgi:DNA (cytosine-5)-methyltransferase 1
VPGTRIRRVTSSDDPKHFLYKEYLRILSSFWPAVFVMENVKGLLSSHPEPEKDPIFQQIIADLTAPAEAEEFEGLPDGPKHTYKLYSLSPKRTDAEPSGRDFVLRAEEHGVPQARHRVIIVGVRDDIDSDAPEALTTQDLVPISKVLKHLPRLRSGVTDKKDNDEVWSQLFHDAADRRWFKSIDSLGPEGLSRVAKSTIKSFKLPNAKRGGEFVAWTPKIDYRKDWYLDAKLLGVCNHVSRPHITKDIYRYFYAACFAKVKKTSQRYSAILQRYSPHRSKCT